MQKGFINKNNEFLVAAIQNLLNQNIFDNVILTKYKNNADSPFVNILGWNGLQDNESQQLVCHSQNASIIEKYSYGIPYCEIQKLKQQQVKEVYLCGTDIDACVLNIAYNLFDNNIKPIFIKELCATSSSNIKLNDYSFAIIERNFGKNCITTIKDFL
jgi:hypothetical protein